MLVAEERDRIALSRDIEVIADRIALSGQTGRADELKVVAAHLRAKEEERTAGPPVSDPAAPRRPYVLAAAAVLSWLAVVLLAVVVLG